MWDELLLLSCFPTLPGASEVVITDREPLSLECAALSARASGFAAFSPMSPPGASLGSIGAPPGVTCTLLDWSLPVPSELLGRCVGTKDGWEQRDGSRWMGAEGWDGVTWLGRWAKASGCKCGINVKVATEAGKCTMTAAILQA